ncbi:MAG: helix-turn-helix domain-containing protein [Actinomycetota bacterium]
MSVESIPKARSLASFIDLVDGLPQVMAAAKDAQGRYLYVNRGFADRVGRRSRDVLGLSVDDLFAPELAASYAAQDAQVLGSGSPLSGHLELIVRSDGRLGWYLTSKSRLMDDEGMVLGVAVISVDLQAQMDSAHSGLAQALDAVRENIDYPWRIGEIADLAGLSTTQLERLCRRTLGMSPRGVLQRLRIEHAVRLLSTTDLTAGEVAAACGFYDQSSFTRQFRAVLGLTPGAYRRSGDEIRGAR